MSRKRPSVIDTLDLAGHAPESPEAPQEPSNVVAMAPAVAPAAQQAAPASAKAPKAAKPRSTVHHTSLYVPKAAYRHIRDIANTGDRKPHDVIVEGIDLVLAKYGFPPVSEHKKK
jgi:hypothetical protein